MWCISILIIIGLLLIIHGFAHWQIATARGSRETAISRLLEESCTL
jgi:hypothetical protein